VALRPPDDFAVKQSERTSPTLREMRDLWEHHQAKCLERERAAQWRQVLEGVRRGRDGKLAVAAPSGALPDYLKERLALGPHSRGALRPVPRSGRVLATGVDTLSTCWYAEPGSPLARAMQGLAIQQARRAWLLPEPVEGCRVGWFPEHGLVFAEGRPGGEGLVPSAALPNVVRRLDGALGDLGVRVASVPSAGLRRLDVAADVWTDSAAEGLALFECLASASLGSGKVVSYRADRRVESVLIKSRSGRTLARVYDKGACSPMGVRGRWIRFEAQWRFPRSTRLDLGGLDSGVLRERFKKRFDAAWKAAGGFRVGGIEVLAGRLGEAVDSGQLSPSRARSVAGYLVLGAAGIDQGARRTSYELERECRELGLAVSLLRSAERRVDLATVLEECLAPAAWR
jgi:hypothetical protein